MALFWRKEEQDIKETSKYQNCKKNPIQNLQITLSEHTPLRFLGFFAVIYQKTKKRTSSPVLSGKKGSLAVEASLILPLFLFSFLNIISILQILSCYSRIETALHQTGRKWALYAYAGDGQEKTADLFAAALIPTEIERYVGKEYLNRCPVIGGRDGLSCYLSQAPDKEEMIDLVVQYKVSPVFSILGFTDFKMVNRCRIRAWTGYKPQGKTDAENEDEIIVYVTEHGTVYHKSPECTHLKLNISRVEAGETDELRNQDGGRYKPCEKCGNMGERQFYYIAAQGDKYHALLGCSGLKRQIKAVPISQTGGMGVCSRCY